MPKSLSEAVALQYVGFGVLGLWQKPRKGGAWWCAMELLRGVPRLVLHLRPPGSSSIVADIESEPNGKSGNLILSSITASVVV